MNEEWRQITGYTDYEVSRLGRVRRSVDRHNSKAGRILKATPDDSGYPRVALYRPLGGKRQKLEAVHRLVCLTFQGPPPTPLHEVAHEDGIRSNCKNDNLRWATKKENHADKKRHGTQQIGVKNPNAQLRPQIVAAIRAMYRKGKFGLSRTAKHFGVGKGTVHQIVRYETWKHL